MVDAGLYWQGMSVGKTTVDTALGQWSTPGKRMPVEITMVDVKCMIGDCLDDSQPDWIILMLGHRASNMYKYYCNG